MLRDGSDIGRAEGVVAQFNSRTSAGLCGPQVGQGRGWLLNACTKHRNSCIFMYMRHMYRYVCIYVCTYMYAHTCMHVCAHMFVGSGLATGLYECGLNASCISK